MTDTNTSSLYIIMAEEQVPTFKCVLVDDGGTGICSLHGVEVQLLKYVHSLNSMLTQRFHNRSYNGYVTTM